MKIIIIALLFITSMYAKLVSTTDLEIASLKAPVVVIATKEKNQLDYLGDKESIIVDIDELWQEFKIDEILYANKIETKINTGEIIRLDPKSNGCIRFKTTIKRESDTLIYTRTLRNNKKDIYTKKIKALIGKKVILFLENSTYNKLYKFSHYGWLLSPLEYNQANIQRVKKLISKRKDNELK